MTVGLDELPSSALVPPCQLDRGASEQLHIPDLTIVVTAGNFPDAQATTKAHCGTQAGWQRACLGYGEKRSARTSNHEAHLVAVSGRAGAVVIGLDGIER